MSKPTAFTGLSETIAVDGKDLLEWGFNLSERPALLGPPARLTTGVRPGIHGEVVWRKRWDSRKFVLRGDVLGDDHAGFIDNLEGLRDLFERDREVILELADTTASQQMRCHVVSFKDPSVIRAHQRAIYGTGAEIELVAHEPFWRATVETAYGSMSGATGTFQALDVGSAESDPIIAALFTGSATTFTIAVGELAFLCSFDWTYTAKNVVGDTITGTKAGNPAFQADAHGGSLRIQRSTSDSLYFSVPGNKDAGGFVWCGRPNWTDGADALYADSTTTPPYYIFHWYGDSSNYCYLRFLPTYASSALDQAGVWQFVVRNAGHELWAQSARQTFARGDQVIIGGSWGATGVHMYVTKDATKQTAALSASANPTGSARDVTANWPMSTNPATLYVGCRQTLDAQSDSYHDELVLFTFQPTDDQFKAEMVDPGRRKREGVITEKATVAKSVDAWDQIILDADKQTVKWWDYTAGTLKEAIDGLTGVIPRFGPGKSVLYVQSGNSNMTFNVRYAKRWL